MDRRFLRRYVVLIFILVLCACAAWYVTNESGQPYADAVLVELPDETDHFSSTERAGAHTQYFCSCADEVRFGMEKRV